MMTNNNAIKKSGINGIVITVDNFKQASIANNLLYGINATGINGASGIVLVGGSGYQNIKIIGNQIGGNASALGLNGQPNYSLNIGGVCDRLICSFNDTTGIPTSGLNLAHTNSAIGSNI